MKGFRLYKFEKLCSKKSIDSLFLAGNNKGCIEYPLRAVWKLNKINKLVINENEHLLVKFLINIPKKKIRHAVDRVSLRRKIREAYRLNKHILYNNIDCINDSHIYLVIDIAFIYLSDKKKSYKLIEQRMISILNKISSSVLIDYK